VINISVDWDFSNLVLEDISTVVNSYGGGGGGGSSTIVPTLPVTLPAVLNTVTVALPPALPTPEVPVPQIEAVVATNTESKQLYGEQSSPVVVTLLSSIAAAQSLAAYLGRPQPVYWYSQIRVMLNRLTSGQQDAVTALELGDQLRVSKRFNGVTGPVVQTLYVEGISHDIRPDSHVVVITTSPAVLFEPFVLDTNRLDDILYGLS
jgi:hypothetical protein